MGRDVSGDPKVARPASWPGGDETQNCSFNSPPIVRGSL